MILRQNWNLRVRRSQMILRQNWNLSQCRKLVSRIGRLSLIIRSRNLQSVSNGENPYESSDVFGVLAGFSFVLRAVFAVPLTFGALGCERLPPPLVVVFLHYCLLFLSLAGRSLVMQQKSSLEMQSEIYFSASWQNLHSVFRRTIIAGFFLELFSLQFSYFWL